MQVFATPGGAGVSQSASGGKTRAYNTIDDASGTIVLPQNGQRRSIIFHNPGSVDLLIYPTTDYNGVALAPSAAARGGAFLVYANGGSLTVNGECQSAWGARAVSGGATNSLTVMESNA
jgi:hypothetical protein